MTKHVEIPHFTDKVVDVPVVAQKQISMTLTVQKSIEISQLQVDDKMVDVPVMLVVLVPQVRIVKKTVETSQLQTAEKIVDIFDANGNRVVNELRRRDCVMREMRKNKPPFRLALNRAASDEIAQHCKHWTERGVTKLHGSGTALADGTRVPVSKMEELIAVHCQASLKTVKDPDREPYPAYPSGKSWCEACGKMGSGQKFYHDVTPGSDFTAEAQQQHKSSKHQLTKQATRQERGGERKKEGNREGKRGRSEQEEGRDQEERKEEERKVEERGSEQVEKDVTGWTVVTRNRRERKMVQIFVRVNGSKATPMDVNRTVVTRNRRERKMVQIFVRVNGSKATPMDVNLTDDKVEDVIRRIQNDEDVYVTMHGRVLRRDEKLKSCEVTDGCTIQVTSRLRGGGKHKDKRSKAEKRPAASAKQPEPLQMEKVLEEMVTCIVEGRDVEGEQRLQSFLATIQKSTGWDKGLLEDMECRIRQAVEEKRRENIEERDQVAEQEQSKKVRFTEEKQPEETQEQSTDKQDVMSGLEELRTGRGSRPLVRGGDEKCRADETSRKGKGKGNRGKGEHDGKAGGAGSKGRQQVENLVMDEDQGNTGVMRREEDQENHREDVRKLVEMMQKEEVEQEEAADGEQQHSQEKGEGGESEEDGRGRVAPNMGAGGSHPQATSDPRKEEKKKNETRVLSWADCNDEEGKENEEEVEEEKEAGQWEKTEERQPGLEEVESKQEAKEEQEVKRKEKQEQEEGGDRKKEVEEKKEQEAERKQKQEQERRAQEAREEQKRAQEAREELKRAQEAREEERKAPEAHEEQKRVQKALEKRKAQEEQEREAKAQEERKKEVRVQEERERVAREAKAQEEREREVNAHEERRKQEREAEAQEGHEGEVKAQEEQAEDSNSLQEESHVSNRHMTWWHNAWWVRVNNGPHLRTARDRRRVWRAATRAAQEVRDTGKVAGGEREKWETGSKESNASNTLHIVLHLSQQQQARPPQQQQQHPQRCGCPCHAVQ